MYLVAFDPNLKPWADRRSFISFDALFGQSTTSAYKNPGSLATFFIPPSHLDHHLLSTFFFCSSANTSIYIDIQWLTTPLNRLSPTNDLAIDVCICYAL